MTRARRSDLISSEVGLQAPAAIWVAFLPMLLVGSAYFFLNRALPDCGTSFVWVARAFGPSAGWLAGWSIVAANLFAMANLAGTSGRYSLLLIGREPTAWNGYLVILLGVAAIALMAAVCYVGIELSAGTQVLLLAAEIATVPVKNSVWLVPTELYLPPQRLIR